MDEILESMGFKLKYDELKKQERETLHEWLAKLQRSELKLDDIRGYIKSMRTSVEQELTKTTNTKEEDYLLKARLRNYMLFDAFLDAPERAKRALEKAMEGVAAK